MAARHAADSMRRKYLFGPFSFFVRGNIINIFVLVMRSALQSCYLFDWLRVKGEEWSSDISHSSSVPTGCHQAALCNLIKMGIERLLCAEAKATCACAAGRPYVMALGLRCHCRAGVSTGQITRAQAN